ncbi:MAG: hypothetical protein ACKOE6_03760 [Flammeovirgaceae bacterium]
MFSSCQKKPIANTVIVDTKSMFDIADEGKFFGDDKDTVRSGLTVNGNDAIGRIWYTRNEHKDDTLRIKIYSFNEVYIHNYLIKVFKGKCIVDYRYEMDADDASVDIDRKIISTGYLVKLNSLDFKKGKEIRGYTEFRGKCVGRDCHGHADIEIKGNFKIRIE